MDVRGVSERRKVIQALVECLTQAADMEGWGLVVEGAEEYQRAARKMTMAVEDQSKALSVSEKEFLSRVAQSLQLRASCLQDLTSDGAAHQLDIKSLMSALQEMGRGGHVAESTLTGLLPPTQSGLVPRAPHTPVSPDDDHSEAVAAKAGSLVSRVSTLPGHTYLTISVDRVGLKDPHNYIDPFITVSVKTLSGADVEPPQDTPVCNQRANLALVFGVGIDIQQPVDELPQGSAIFLELKHYKPKKGAISTKCFSFMEMDEIKAGPAVLEIYKKPTDYHRKKLSLLSAKPLYFNLTLTLHRT